MAGSSNTLPPFSRHITTHTPDGIALFHTSKPSTATDTVGNTPSTSLEPTWQHISKSAFFLAYATHSVPAELNGDSDLKAYDEDVKNPPPGVSIPGGTALRVIDMAPNTASPMHRTVSLDYAVMLEGEIELTLDSGQTRLLKRGDIVVQRGTMHRWRNPSDTEYARILFVILNSNKVVNRDHVELDEDFSDPAVAPVRSD